MTQKPSRAEDRVNFIDIPELCRNRKRFLGIGILLVALGALAIGAAFFTTLITVVLLGGILLAGGLIQMVQSFWAKNHTHFFLYLFLGILNAVAGVIIILYPHLSAISLTLLIAFSFIATGVLRIMSSLITRPNAWFWFFLNGVIALILGLMVLAEWPSSSLWVIGLFVGVDLLMSGWSLIILYTQLNRSRCLLDNTQEETVHDKI